MAVIREKSMFAPILTCRPTLPFFVFIFQLTPTHSRSRRQLVEETIHLAPVLTAILHHSLDVNNHCLSQFIEQIICVIVVKATLHQQHLPKAQTRPRPSIAPSGVSLSHRILKPNSYVQPKYLCPSSSSDSHSLCEKIKRHYATHLREYHQTKRVSPEKPTLRLMLLLFLFPNFFTLSSHLLLMYLLPLTKNPWRLVTASATGKGSRHHFRWLWLLSNMPSSYNGCSGLHPAQLFFLRQVHYCFHCDSQRLPFSSLGILILTGLAEHPHWCVPNDSNCLDCS